jgi:predicted TIM-barrel fold metal-dependent hydrolase
MTIVDVHCHVFNADDLPVRGFVEHLHLDTPVLGPLLSTLIDRIVQGKAPGYSSDMARIQRLLTHGGGAEQLETLGVPVDALEALGVSAPSLDAQADAAFAELLVEDPVFVHRLAAAGTQEAYGAEAVQEAITAEGLGDQLANARRLVRWAALFAMSRLDIASELVHNISDEVDLYCPLLVDLGAGLGDNPKTTVRQQVEMLGGISILSMRGQLPGGGKARLHPFVGFDPRAQVRAELARQPVKPLDVVKDAVHQHGFIGVKLYPPMGWRPLGNAATIDMTSSEAERLDAVLGDFYTWCENEDVPITAHANRSNFADPSFADFAGPTGWELVLESFPQLRVNLGHFGGATAELGPGSWPARMIDLALRHDHVYVDTGNHRIHDSGMASAYLRSLALLLQASDRKEMASRLMFGSDWFMLASLPNHQQFLDTYRDLFEQQFGQPATQNFLGGNALRFLGFADPGTKNADRLRDHYRRHASSDTPRWLAEGT